MTPGSPGKLARGAPRRFLVGASVGAVAAWAAEVAAQTAPTIEITWTAPPGCPVTADVQKGVRRLLGGAGETSAPSEPLVVDAAVTRVKGRYRLRLNLRRGGETDTRDLDSDSCDSLAGAAEVSVALLARGEQHAATLAPPTPPSAPASGPASSRPSDGAAPLASASSESRGPPIASPSTAAPPPAPVSSAAPTAAPELSASAGSPPSHPGPEIRELSDAGRRGLDSPPRSGIALQVPILAFDEGTIPSASYGLGLGVGFRARRFEIVVAGELWLPQSDADETGSFGATYKRASGELSGCYGWDLARFELAPCLEIGLEYVTARGSGPAQTPPDFGTWSAGAAWATVGVAARASWFPLRWTALFVRPSLALNTSRPSFIINEASSLYRVPLAALGIDLGCEWIL